MIVSQMSGNVTVVVVSLLQVIRMLIVIIVVFLVCWGPHLIINTLKRLELKVYTTGAYHVWVG